MNSCVRRTMAIRADKTMHYNQICVYTMYAQYVHFSEILRLTYYNSWAMVSLSLVFPPFVFPFLSDFFSPFSWFWSQYLVVQTKCLIKSHDVRCPHRMHHLPQSGFFYSDSALWCQHSVITPTNQLASQFSGLGQPISVSPLKGREMSEKSKSRNIHIFDILLW